MNDKPDLEQVLAAAKAVSPEIIRIVRTLHADPEISLQETRAAALLTGILAANGFAVEAGLAGMGTAFRGRSGSGRPSIALIAEMDALPGLGHACGHNIIAAAATGAALILRSLLPPDAAAVSIFGTPAEELGIGKIAMIQAGCFAGIDFAMMVHPSSRRQVIKHFLGLTKIRFTFYGRPAHAAAYPEEGVNALDAVIQTFNCRQCTASADPAGRQDSRHHHRRGDGAEHHSGTSLLLFLRQGGRSAGTWNGSRERVAACAAGAALATGCRLETEADPRVIAPLKITPLLLPALFRTA